MPFCRGPAALDEGRDRICRGVKADQVKYCDVDNVTRCGTVWESVLREKSHRCVENSFTSTKHRKATQIGVNQQGNVGSVNKRVEYKWIDVDKQQQKLSGVVADVFALGGVGSVWLDTLIALKSPTLQFHQCDNRVQLLSQDNWIKQRRAWLLLGWVIAKRSCPCKQPACPAIGRGSEVTFKPLIPRLSVREGFLALIRLSKPTAALNDIEISLSKHKAASVAAGANQANYNITDKGSTKTRDMNAE
ncbi:hypothetical protein J6590_023908 [Homalodisca vitripennis]|nr:hypothetical protein J6590_023908 [Homalodisca vitripennis]